MWILTIRSSIHPPIVYKLKSGKNTLGRQPDNDIVLSDESASRKHAEITMQEDKLVITDLKSTNGTFVNRDRLTKPVILRSGDQIRIGQQIARLTNRNDKNGGEPDSSYSITRPLTRDLLLASVDQNALLLYEVSNRLNTILDLKIAMHEVSQLMCESMAAEKCEVILAEAFDRLSELGFPTMFAQKAIEQLSVVVIPDLAAQSDDYPSQSAILLRIRSVLCVPVIIDKEVTALIYVYKTDPSARPFDENDVQLAVAISHQAALTIQRSKLMERSHFLEESLNIDSLTTLSSRDHFLSLAEREYQRAQRFQHRMSLMMLDIDEFKLINDTFGHRVGDQVLHDLGLRCLSHVRGVDLIGRYGGDEFIVLLVETNGTESYQIAERMRLSIANLPVETEKGPQNITVSIGIAAIWKECTDLTTLISRADSALYQAKRSGRNLSVLVE
jgi:diguanylate cyclase (GGDEF)-like protein